jgi:hypothetical protein
MLLRDRRILLDMVAGWKFSGEFRRGRKQCLALECIVALPNRLRAEQIAVEKLIGADAISVTALSRAELIALKIEDGEVRL